MSRLASLTLALFAAAPLAARADLGPARQLTGEKLAVHNSALLFIFPFNDSIAMIDVKGQLWLQDFGAKLGAAHLIKGASIAVGGQRATYCFALGRDRIAVVNVGHQLWIHDIGATVAPARQLAGVVEGFSGTATFAFPWTTNQIAAVDAQGHFSLQTVDSKLAAPEVITGAPIAYDGTPAVAVLPMGKSVEVINANAEVWQHDILEKVSAPHQVVGKVTSGTRPATRWFMKDGSLYTVNTESELWAQEVKP